MQTLLDDKTAVADGSITSIATPKTQAGFASWTLPLFVAVAAIAAWSAIIAFRILPSSAFPSPLDVLCGFSEELHSGSLFKDIVASLFRVACGFALAVIIGLPVGIWLGSSLAARRAMLPYVNFFRSLSPLAWIPFALLLFGIGDVPAIFLVFLAAVFPLILATMSAIGTIPSVFFQVAREYEITGASKWWSIVFPAIAPDVITALRVTAGLSWLVLVAAEMLGCQDGLGHAVWDARNGLRMDLLVVAMITIGCIGVIVDRLLVRLTRIPSVRWGYER
ncbi:MAG: ABC transporter permease [Planctomycetes bacterium]|nr:ABC transporter permease [Planctomycetota bacterium]MBI3836190.1 ABC transporter permease [Planctomycetota bacterium]